uniref:PH domain-containing protein n=3 Tax=Rhodosorus marinus TaxID=101924 RepID=A0A7S0BEL6_9RHOD|mmetsp:Transcript_11913/g.17228  ORF Transcript_11913/g.17228 Transcript_11913/m.17228 type:complete len:458 (+) Transcript_11913:267-1640(+)
MSTLRKEGTGSEGREAMQPAPLTPYRESRAKRQGPLTPIRPESVRPSTGCNIAEKDLLRIERVQKRFLEALAAAREAKIRADSAPQESKTLFKEELLRKLKELEAVNLEAQETLRQEDFTSQYKSLKSIQGTLLEHKAVAADLRGRIKNLEKIVEAETRYRSTDRAENSPGTHPIKKGNSMGDETLCLMRHDVEALKLELFRLQKGSQTTSAAKVNQQVAPPTNMSYLEGLDRLRERLGRLEKPLRRNTLYRLERTPPRASTRGTNRTSQQIQDEDSRRSDDTALSTLSQLPLRSVADRARSSPSHNSQNSPAPPPPEVDVPESVMKHPEAKRSLKELQRYSLKSKMNTDSEFTGMMLWVKRGKLVRRWRERFVSIVEHRFFGEVLCLFKYDNNVVDGTNSKLIVLRNTRCTREGEIDAQYEHRYVFRLATSKKEYWFSTSDAQKREEWLQRLSVPR